MSSDFLSKNFFEVFDIQVSSEINLIKLSDVYRELQKTVHPDRFAQGSELEQRVAMQKTSFINEAFHTLKVPLDRIQYMLKLKGVDMESETDTSMDGAFLMQQMEFRESIDSVRAQASQLSDPLDKLDAMLQTTKAQVAELMQEFKDSYQSSDLKTARDIIRKMQFLIKAQKEINEISEQLEDEMF